MEDDEGLPNPSWRERALRAARDAAATLGLAFVLLVIVGYLRAPDLPEIAPDFTLRTLEGETVQLSSLRGKTVVLNFWATWCGPCRLEAPTLTAFAAAHPDVVVLGIAEDQDPAKLRRGVRDLGIGYPVAAGSAEVLRTYGISTYPTTVFVGPDGDVRWIHTGLLVRPQLAWGAGKWW